MGKNNFKNNLEEEEEKIVIKRNRQARRSPTDEFGWTMHKEQHPQHL